MPIEELCGVKKAKNKWRACLGLHKYNLFDLRSSFEKQWVESNAESSGEEQWWWSSCEEQWWWSSGGEQ